MTTAPPAAGAMRSDAGNWHARSPDRALREFRSSPTGLSETEAARRLEQAGPNELPRQAGESVLSLLRNQFAQPLIYVLLAAAAVSAALAHWVDTGVILGVVIANATVGFVQEYRASRAIESLLELITPDCTAVRGGRERVIPAREVVPGDVLILRPGDKVAADARLLDVRGLLVDEAILTGESVPVEKRADAPVDAAASLAERPTAIYAGTLAAAGSGRGLVTATGGSTELARISDLVGGARPLATPLTRKIVAFSRMITFAIVGLAVITFGVSQLRGYDPVDGFLAAVALAVAAIPEGLPAIMTITLALGVRRMAARRSLMRRLPAVETLGSATVICSDKTGTLTRNEMAVSELFTGEPIAVSGDGYEPDGSFRRGSEELERPPEETRALLEAALLCCDARLVSHDGRAAVEGDPTEGALVVAAAKAGIERDAAGSRWPRVDELPFDSERRFMATVHDAAEADARRTILKGAPEAVVPACDSLAWQEAVDHDAVLAAAEEMAGRGLRVLAVAQKPAAEALEPLGDGMPPSGYRLLGLAGMLDPPRAEAVQAVADCKEAGIRIVMITGDHPRTAAAIASHVGIAAANVATGKDLESRSDEELEEIASGTSVFARAEPEHKLRLVAALQRRQEVVAVTGDGVNDAAALKQADIGVAMGVTGTDVAKEASDLVLQDDNFATIRAAVEEGRRVYDNIVKSIVFILPTNAGESLLVLGAIALGMTLPVLPLQILWINLVTAVALALPLALEALEPGTMRRPPRRQSEPVLGSFAVRQIALVGVLMLVAALLLFEYERARGVPLDEARTTVVAVIVLIEAFYLLTCRSLHGPVRDVGFLSNPAVYAGIGAVIAVQLGYTYLPVMNELFDSAPIGAGEWLRALVLASAVVPLALLHKRLSRGS